MGGRPGSAEGPLGSPCVLSRRQPERFPEAHFILVRPRQRGANLSKVTSCGALDFPTPTLLHWPSFLAGAHGSLRVSRGIGGCPYTAVRERLGLSQAFVIGGIRLCRPAPSHACSSTRASASFATRAGSNTFSTAAPCGRRSSSCYAKGSASSSRQRNPVKAPVPGTFD